MLFDFSIIPVGTSEHVSPEIAEALKIIQSSGLPYILTPSSTCIEGEWDEVINLIQKCHRQVRKYTPHVVTMVKIEDDAGDHEKLRHNIESVEEKVGHELRTH